MHVGMHVFWAFIVPSRNDACPADAVEGGRPLLGAHCVGWVGADGGVDRVEMLSAPPWTLIPRCSGVSDGPALGKAESFLLVWHCYTLRQYQMP
jgi:hypothetical protein